MTVDQARQKFERMWARAAPALKEGYASHARNGATPSEVAEAAGAPLKSSTGTDSRTADQMAREKTRSRILQQGGAYGSIGEAALKEYDARTPAKPAAPSSTFAELTKAPPVPKSGTISVGDKSTAASGWLPPVPMPPVVTAPKIMLPDAGLVTSYFPKGEKPAAPTPVPVMPARVASVAKPFPTDSQRAAYNALPDDTPLDTISNFTPAERAAIDKLPVMPERSELATPAIASRNPVAQFPSYQDLTPISADYTAPSARKPDRPTDNATPAIAARSVADLRREDDSATPAIAALTRTFTPEEAAAYKSRPGVVARRARFAADKATALPDSSTPLERTADGVLGTIDRGITRGYDAVASFVRPDVKAAEIAKKNQTNWAAEDASKSAADKKRADAVAAVTGKTTSTATPPPNVPPATTNEAQVAAPAPAAQASPAAPVKANEQELIGMRRGVPQYQPKTIAAPAAPAQMAGAQTMMERDGVVPMARTAALPQRGPASQPERTGSTLQTGAFSDASYARTRAAEQKGINDVAIRSGSASDEIKATNPALSTSVANGFAADKAISRLKSNKLQGSTPARR
jgi:hypothetical protein